MINLVVFSSFAALTRSVLVVLVLACCRPAAAQAPAWQTARVVAATAAGPGNASRVAATAADAAGNVYVAGTFTNTVVLGSITLTSAGYYDVYVAKFSLASNQFLWAQRAGGTSYEFVSGLAVSGTSVYVAGSFYSPSARFGNANLTNGGGLDAFVAKLTDAGTSANFVWAQGAGGWGEDFVNALAVTGTNVYVAGGFGGIAASFGTTVLTSAAVVDVFVAKLTDAGPTATFAWAQRAGGRNYNYAAALAVSGTTLYVGGKFNSPTADFGTIVLNNAGLEDAFVAKLTDAGSTGTFGWAQRAGGSGSDYATALAVSGANVYVAGKFDSSAASFGASVLNTAGVEDAFVAKLTDAGSTGTFGWAQRAGGSGSDYATALAVSGASVYVAGAIGSPAASFGTSVLSAAGYADAFVAKLTDAGSAGTFGWAQQAGGSDFDVAAALTISGARVCVAGDFNSPTATFGPLTLTHTSFGSGLGFLASLTDLTLPATAAALPREPASLFPNPARASATLRRPAGAGAAALTLTDALGRTVRRYPAPAGPTDTALDLGGLPAGLYLLRGAGPALRLTVE